MSARTIVGGVPYPFFLSSQIPLPLLTRSPRFPQREPFHDFRSPMWRGSRNRRTSVKWWIMRILAAGVRRILLERLPQGNVFHVD